MSKLAGKVAVVTGASKGIGAGIAKALAAQGASVVVNYASSSAGADAVVQAITDSGGKAIAVKGDVSKAADAEALIGEAISAYGRLDILVNNAGVYSWEALGEITEEKFDRQFSVNVLGLLFVTQAAEKHLGEGASVINISSAITSMLPANSSVYSATKGAVDAITGVLAKELGPRGIRVNAILPGIVVTEGTQAAGFTGGELEAGIVAQTPLGRSGRPDDIGDVAAFLASEDARWLTGERITAGGGFR
jgi:3-oxoacyl-[acyl-carrier protein] reductase